MKTFLLISIFIIALYTSCSAQNGCDGSINSLPMYGKAKKCKEQLQADQEFIKQADHLFNNDRKAASSYYAKRGWDYIYQHKVDTAMFRFNQAWMLDSLNATAYWGFADLLGMQQKFKESIPFFERAEKLNPTNARLWTDASTSYGNLFMQTRDVSYLNKSISSLKKAASLDPKNPQVFAQLTAAYTYYMQKDSARKYLRITDQLDKNAVNPEVRKVLTGQ